MSPADDSSQRWETLPNFRERMGVTPYQPPATDSLDPVVVQGSQAKSDLRLRTAQYVAAGFSCAVGAFSLTPHTLPFLLIPLVIVTGVAIIGHLRTRRPRGWRLPRLVASAEGLTVSDTAGSTSVVLWQEATELTVRATALRDLTAVSVEWTDPAGDLQVADLGDTVDLMEVYDAIRGRAPSMTEVNGMPRMLFGAPETAPSRGVSTCPDTPTRPRVS